jgi:lysyl-tRNA synthetase class II
MEIDNYKLSLAINTIRKFLLNNAFFETHLYSTLNYKIENTSTFQLKDKLFLRYNPEPDIWQIGEKHNKFFWIGSMFRDEPKLSPLHSYEFTVVDIYEIGDKESVKKRFIEILNYLEKELSLKPLSKKIVEVDYKDKFNNIKEKECWILVNEYPAEESFYDTKLKNERTKKFEFFYKNGDSIIETVACGELGENANSRHYVKDEKNIVKSSLFNKKFIGFGIGIERLLFLYSKK